MGMWSLYVLMQVELCRFTAFICNMLCAVLVRYRNLPPLVMYPECISKLSLSDSSHLVKILMVWLVLLVFSVGYLKLI